jgi:hypothetical protein
MGSSEKAMELIWGADEIAKAIGRSRRSTFHMLDSGQLPAKKVGGRWVAERGRLVNFFMEEATTGAQPGSTAPAAART